MFSLCSIFSKLGTFFHGIELKLEKLWHYKFLLKTHNKYTAKIFMRLILNEARKFFGTTKFLLICITKMNRCNFFTVFNFN